MVLDEWREAFELMKAELAEAVAEGILSQGAMLLDHIGIRINTRTLPSHDAFNRAQRAMYGSGFWSAMWCQHIRPWLTPMRHRKIKARHRCWQLQFQRELLGAVLDAGMEGGITGGGGG